ncbi:MAG: dUTP diphosphatase [Nanoarchaeota archaeon]
MISIKIKKLNPDAIIPCYAHKGDAGMDIFSCENCILKAGERKGILTGISMELPLGYVALVWDKSGLALNKGIKTMAGVCDAGYRGEYKIVLFNTSREENININKGDKIAQILIQKVEQCEIKEVSELENSSRGENGFGSTGK